MAGLASAPIIWQSSNLANCFETLSPCGNYLKDPHCLDWWTAVCRRRPFFGPRRLLGASDEWCRQLGNINPNADDVGLLYCNCNFSQTSFDLPLSPCLLHDVPVICKVIITNERRKTDVIIDRFFLITSCTYTTKETKLNN